MWKLNISLVLVAIAAISISRRMRLSGKYERNDKKVREVSDWKALDRGIDPTDGDDNR
ncbi:MAG: hypothetical protein RLZZ277_1250 [Actinomycetota bacterium]|jgi:hypothetical protein